MKNARSAISRLKDFADIADITKDLKMPIADIAVGSYRVTERIFSVVYVTGAYVRAFLRAREGCVYMQRFMQIMQTENIKNAAVFVPVAAAVTRC